MVLKTSEGAPDRAKRGVGGSAAREQELIDAADRAVAERVRHSTAAGERVVVAKGLPGVQKMSEVLGEFAEPLVQNCRSHADRRKVLSLAMVAWNAALLPEEDRAGFLREFKLEEVLQPEGMRLMAYLIRRKLDFFPEDTRLVLDFEVAELDQERMHLSVVSRLNVDDPKTLAALKAKGLLPGKEGASNPG